MADIRWQQAPRPWRVTDFDAMGRPRRLLVGARPVALADVARWRIDRVAETNVTGYLALAMLFLVSGCLVVIPVAMGFIEPRYLLAAVLFILIGLTAFGDLGRARPIDLVHVRLRLTTGDEIAFATSEPAEAAAFVAVLQEAGISRLGG